MRLVWRYRHGGMKHSESGYIMVTALFVMMIMLLVALAVIVVGSSEVQVASRTSLNDDAYQNAEAGINRALLFAKDNYWITNTSDGSETPPVGSVSTLNPPLETARYWVDRGYTSRTGTPQWDSGSCTFANGTYSVEIWQSGRAGETTLTNSKVIRSTGTAVKGGVTATRVIEARVGFSNVDPQYDACLSFTIFNGNNQTPDGVTPPAWPPSSTVWAGGVTINGRDACPLTGYIPRGAIYTRGPIDMNVALLGGYTVLGNMISTDYIKLSDFASLGGDMTYDGNVIAGIDPSNPSDSNMGKIMTDVSWAIAATVKCTKYVAGTGNVDVNVTGVAGSRVLEFGGILSGGRVSCWGIGAGTLKLGRIHAAGGLNGADIQESNGTYRPTVDVRQSLAAAKYTSINCGHLNRDITGTDIGILQAMYDIMSFLGAKTYKFDHVGVGFFNAAGGISGGDIFTDGKFMTFTPAGGVSIGTLYANGHDSIGVSADPVTTAGAFSATAIKSVGETRGICIIGAMNIGTIQAGTSNVAAGMSDNEGIALLVGGGALTGGSTTCEATGNVNLYVVAGGGTFGPVKSNNNIKFQTWVGGSTAGGIWAGHDVEIISTLGGITTGLIPGDSSYGVKSGHNTSLECYAGGIVVGTHSIWKWDNWFDSDGKVKHGGSYNTVWIGPIYCHGDNGGSTPGPGLTAPAATAYNEALPTVSPGGNPTIVSDKLAKTPPTVDQSLLLTLAGLSRPVDLIEPNWEWYREQARGQDAMSGSNKRHLVYDGMTGVDLDGDSGNGSITMVWDGTSGYSSNEVVFAQNNEDIVIRSLDWSGLGANFTGTIITKGNIYMGVDSGTNWNFTTRQSVNLGAGNDIWVGKSGFNISSSTDDNFHFYAGRDIDVRDVSNWSLVGTTSYTGSWCAGNRVYYNSHALITNMTFRFSRWVVPADAWLPPYRVYSWREV